MVFAVPSVMARLVLVLGLTLAMVTAAFAHKVPTLQDLQIDAWVLAGGDAGDLCGDVGSPAHDRDCLFCTLGATSLASGPTSYLRDAELRILATVVWPDIATAEATDRVTATSPRGPPTA
jgi:hypothetical protein